MIIFTQILKYFVSLFLYSIRLIRPLGPFHRKSATSPQFYFRFCQLINFHNARSTLNLSHNYPLIFCATHSRSTQNHPKSLNRTQDCSFHSGSAISPLITINFPPPNPLSAVPDSIATISTQFTSRFHHKTQSRQITHFSSLNRLKTAQIQQQNKYFLLSNSNSQPIVIITTTISSENRRRNSPKFQFQPANQLNCSPPSHC